MLQLATSAHREAVNRLGQQIHTLHVGFRPDHFCAAEEIFPQERFQKEVSERNLYVAILEEQVVGYALLRIRTYEGPLVANRRVMVIEEFCVEEMLRGHGIGKAMMADVRALAKAFRCKELRLSVYPQNDDAVAFYQKCGFLIRTIDMDCKL